MNFLTALSNFNAQRESKQCKQNSKAQRPKFVTAHHHHKRKQGSKQGSKLGGIRIVQCLFLAPKFLKTLTLQHIDERVLLFFSTTFEAATTYKSKRSLHTLLQSETLVNSP